MRRPDVQTASGHASPRSAIPKVSLLADLCNLTPRPDFQLKSRRPSRQNGQGRLQGNHRLLFRNVMTSRVAASFWDTLVQTLAPFFTHDFCMATASSVLPAI